MSAGSSSPGSGNFHRGERVAHSPRGPRVAFSINPAQPKALRAVMPPLLVPPPPPPPPPVPVSTTPAQPSPSSFPVPTQLNAPNLLQINQQLTSLPAKFDATKPPPPIPQPAKMSRKRSAASPEAGPSKARKVEDTCYIDNLCDNCVQRQIRVELLRQDLQSFQKDKDSKTEVYTKKCEDYEHGKLLMRSIVNPDLYKFIEQYIEEDTSSPGSHIQDQPQFAQVSSLTTTGISTSNKPFMRQLLERVFDNGTRSLLEPPSITINNLDDPIFNSLSTFTRSRTSPVKRGTAEVFQTLLDLMCDSRNVTDMTSESRTTNIFNAETLSSRSSFTSMMSGFTQLINSQRTKSPSPEVKANIVQSATGIASTSFTNPGVALPNTLISSPPPNYVRFQPNVPPPITRPMFSPPSLNSIPASSMPNTNPYKPTVQMGVSPTLNPRPTVSGSSSPQQAAQNVRYPGNFPMPPHYYPPYQ